MNRFFVSALAIVASTSLIAGQASAAIIEGPVFVDGINQYTLLTGNAAETVDDLQAYASGTLGGNLVTINSAAENAFLVTNFSASFGPTEYAAIGYNDIATDGDYVWFSGQTPGYENWNTLEPNGGAVEDYVFIVFNAGSVSGEWLDDVGTFTSVGIAEVLIPEPASMALLGLGGLLLAGRNRRTA